MGRGQRFRRVVMWSAGVVLGLSVVAWGASLFRITMATDHLGVALWKGVVLVSWTEPPRVSGGVEAFGFYWPVRWWPDSQDQFVEFMKIIYVCWWDAYVPLWIPAAAAASVLAASAALRRKAHRSATHCNTRNYDLTGIDGVCSECGGKR